MHDDRIHDMKVRHFKAANRSSGLCPITGRNATLITGISSLEKPDITVEKVIEGDFVEYKVHLDGCLRTTDECLVIFIGTRAGQHQVDLVLY